jgi:GAF domain/ANTAR domain
VDGVEDVRARFCAVMSVPGRGGVVADRLCGACVELLGVDEAALSVMYDGTLSRPFGASSAACRELDELQFTLGDGPCWDALRSSAPVLVPDLNAPPATRWPGFAGEAMLRGVRAVFALPVFVASLPIGALDLYRSSPGEMDATALAGGLMAAELATLPLLDLMGIDLAAAVEDETSSAWDELGALTRVEVYQAAGMLIARLGVSSAEALVRLRGYAYAHDMTASEVAYEIIERRLRITDDQVGSQPDEEV